MKQQTIIISYSNDNIKINLIKETTQILIGDDIGDEDDQWCVESDEHSYFIEWSAIENTPTVTCKSDYDTTISRFNSMINSVNNGTWINPIKN